MKTEKEIRKVLDKVDTGVRTKYPAMTYEEGIEEALGWVVEDIPDDEFDPIGK